MKKSLLWMVLLSMLQVSAWAGENVDQQLDAAADGYVNFSNVMGKVKFVVWAEDKVRVQGTLSDDAEEFIFEREGKQISIQVKMKDKRQFRSGDGDDLVISLPATNHLAVSSVNTEVWVRGLKNGAEIEVVNGDVEAAELSGKVEITTVNGAIDVQSLHGDITLATVNGSIKDDGSTGSRLQYASVNGEIEGRSQNESVSLETVNGEAEMSFLNVIDLNMSTVNGELDVSLSLQKNASVQVSSVSGEIELDFVDKVSARFDIETHGGDIRNRLTNDRVKKAKYGPTKWLSFVVNGGEGKVDVTTVSGEITINGQ